MRKQPTNLIKSERSLEFFNGQYLVRTTDGTAERYKFLSPAAVNAAFRNAPIDSGWLSEGVVRCGGGIGGDFAVMFVGARKHTLLLESARGARPQKVVVPLPSFVFFGCRKSFSVWSTAEAEFVPDAALWHAPLPNVFNNGSICWGTNQPPVASGTTIRKAWDLFIGSPFNGHAASGKSRTHGEDVRGLLRQLARSGNKFPAKELLPLHEKLDTRVRRLIGEQHEE